MNENTTNTEMHEGQAEYLESVHKYGKIWGLALFIIISLFPLVVGILFGAKPLWTPLFKGILGVLPLYWAVGIIEIFTYVPMLGAGASYLSFVTGNISNLKLPCALDAMAKADVKPTSEEGELISTISIAVSSITTTFIIILGVIMINLLAPVLNNPVLTPCFSQLLPALFGGLAVVFVSKNVKLAIPPIVLMMILFIFVPALNAGTVGIMVPVGVLFTLGLARIFYKKGII